MTSLAGSEVFLLAALGAGLACDQNVGFLFQVSQPLVAAALAGAITGQFEAAVAAGAVVQLIWLVVQPVGGARLVDTGLAGVTAAVSVPAGVTSGGSAWLDDTLLAGAVVVAVLMAYAGGALLLLQRRLHARMLRRVQECVERQEVRALQRLHLSTICLHGLRGAVSVCLAIFLMPPVAHWLTDHGLVVPVGRLALGLGIVCLARISGGIRNAWLVLGALAGLLLGVM